MTLQELGSAGDALDFGGAGLFLRPCHRTSWPLHRGTSTSTFAPEFEAKHELDPTIEAQW